MKKINLSKIEHRGTLRIKVAFKRDAGYISKIKTIHGRRWSKTKNCWHLPYSKESFEQLKIVFGEEHLVFPKKRKVDDVEKKKTIVVLPKKDIGISDPLDPKKSREVFNKIFTVVDEHTPFPVGDFLEKKENVLEGIDEDINEKILFETIQRFGKSVKVVVGEKVVVEKVNEKWLRVYVPLEKKNGLRSSKILRGENGRRKGFVG